MNLLFASQKLPFSIAFALMLGLGIVQMLSLLIGGDLEHLAQSWLPEQPGDILGFLHVGRTPFLILLLLFLTSFALSGFSLQLFYRSLAGDYLPALVAMLPASAIALASVRVLGGKIAKFIPNVETQAVSETSFIGKRAIISNGVASKAQPAQARLRDAFSQTHYVMVEPDHDDEQFPTGTPIILIDHKGGYFSAMRNPADDIK
jgi:hypothetical protein